MLMGMDWGPILKQLELGFPVRGLRWTFFSEDQHLIEMPPLLPPHVTNGGYCSQWALDHFYTICENIAHGTLL